MSGTAHRVTGGLIAGLFAAIVAGATATAQVSLGQKHDNSQPIEISADSLEVEQDKQIATFRGKVDAIQGEMHLRADTLVVHYRQKSDPGGKASQAKRPARAGNTGGDPFGGGAIARIDANGNVFVSSPEETAQGDTGVYDVDKRTIVLDGQKVVLTRGKNVLRGTHAVMNLDTGHSTLDVPQGMRVTGEFVPEKKGEQPDEPQPAGKVKVK